MQVEFAPYGSTFVVFRSPAGKGRPLFASNLVGFKTVQELGGPWEVSFGTNTLSFAELVDWTTRPEIRYFSGTATYRKTFDAPTTGQSLFLDLGDLSMLAQVRLNGKDLGVAWCPPWRVEITDTVKASGNQLEIDVVNGWWNQLVGDPKKERTKTNIRLPQKAKPQASGLFGPVKLLHRVAP